MRERVVLVLCALVALTVGVATATADDANAKLCQQGGWQSTAFTQSGATFASQAACVAYAAHGGTIASVVASTAIVRCSNGDPNSHELCWGAITGHGLEPTDFTSPNPSHIAFTILNPDGTTRAQINRPVDARGNASFPPPLGCDPSDDLGVTFYVTATTAAGATITTKTVAVPC
jgi:hypothetical protein